MIVERVGQRDRERGRERELAGESRKKRAGERVSTKGRESRTGEREREREQEREDAGGEHRQ